MKSKNEKVKNNVLKKQDEQIDSISDLFSTLSHPARIKILWLLKKRGELNVQEIQKELKISQSNASQHLSILKTHKLLIEKRKGKEVFYSLKESKRLSKVLASAIHLVGYQIAANSELLSTYTELMSFWA